MASRAWLFGALPILLVGVGGCPVTDDYYIESSPVLGAAGQTLADHTTLVAGGSSAGSDGSVGAAGRAGSETGGGGTVQAGGGAPDVAGGAAGDTCVPSTERCNGHDDDCDDLIDELACNSMLNSTVGCSGFVLPDDPVHGYMLCIGTKDYSHAQEACAAQNMRLAWLETAAENSAVSKKVAALSKDAEVSFGANDLDNEGHWEWDGGRQFWNGDENGQPVDGLFSAWTEGTPNDENNDEDCAVLMSATSTWGDRSCTAKYAYLCEELAP